MTELPLYRDPRLGSISGEIIRLVRLVLVDGISDFSIDELKEMHQGRRKIWRKFTYKLFRNWKEAQRDILAIQMTLWNENPKFQQDPFLLYFYRSTQRILDCVLWHHYGPDVTDMKRLYEFEPKIQNLNEHNIDSHIRAMESVNSSTSQFALITDLTSGVRIGDLFVVDNERRRSFVEVKEGAVNEKIIEAKENNDAEMLKELKRDKNTAKQIKRIERQKDRFVETHKMLNNEVGIDDRFGKLSNGLVTTINPKPFDDFSESLRNLLLKFEEDKNLAIAKTEIEDCFLVIAYKPFQSNVIARDEIIKKYENGSTIKGWRFNWADNLLASTVARPLYMQPIDPKSIDMLIRLELVVDFYFSLNKFKSIFSNEKTKIFFNDKKFFRKKYEDLKKLQGPSPMYEVNKGCLFFEFQDVEKGEIYMLSEGLFMRVLSNLIKPSYLLYLHEFMAKSFVKMKEDKS